MLSPLEYRYALLANDDKAVQAFQEVAQQAARKFAARSPNDYHECYSVALTSILAARKSYDPAYEYNAYRWVRRKIISDLRTWCRDRREERKPVQMDDWDSIVDEGRNPEQEIMETERESKVKSLITQALAALTPRQKQIMTRLHLEPANKPSYEELAKEIGVSFSVVKKDANIAMQELRLWMQRRNLNMSIL